MESMPTSLEEAIKLLQVQQSHINDLQSEVANLKTTIESLTNLLDQQQKIAVSLMSEKQSIIDSKEKVLEYNNL